VPSSALKIGSGRRLVAGGIPRTDRAFDPSAPVEMGKLGARLSPTLLLTTRT